MELPHPLHKLSQMSATSLSYLIVFLLCVAGTCLPYVGGAEGGPDFNDTESVFYFTVFSFHDSR